MIDNTSTPVAAAEEPRKDKRRPIIAFALAALAVGGIGAAATSAAWTDNVFFSADAQAATFNLQGSLDGETWVESDKTDGADGAITLVVPEDEFANLVPGETRTVDLQIKNASSVAASLADPTAVFASSSFILNPAVTVEGLEKTLAPGTTDTFQLTVTTDPDWAGENQEKSGTIVVTIQGTAVADAAGN